MRSYGVQGRAAAQIEAQHEKVPRTHAEWLENLGLAVDLRVGEHRYWVVHAGIPSWDSFAVLAIDTGCGTIADGQLSAVLLPDRRSSRSATGERR